VFDPFLYACFIPVAIYGISGRWHYENLSKWSFVALGVHTYRMSQANCNHQWLYLSQLYPNRCY